MLLLAAIGLCGEAARGRSPAARGGRWGSIPLDGKAAPGSRPGVEDPHLAAGEIEDRELHANCIHICIHIIEKVVFDPHGTLRPSPLGVKTAGCRAKRPMSGWSRLSKATCRLLVAFGVTGWATSNGRVLSRIRPAKRVLYANTSARKSISICSPVRCWSMRGSATSNPSAVCCAMV